MRVLLYYLPAAVWAGILLFVGGQSEISPPRLPIPMQDKVMHFLAYGVLGGLVAWARVRSGWRPERVWPLLITMSAIGALDELRQTAVPGRYGEVGDWVADTLGALAFFALVTWWLGLRPRGAR